jgi:hypothetical protein
MEQSKASFTMSKLMGSKSSRALWAENLGQVAASARGETKLLTLIVAIGIAKMAFVVLTWRVKVDNLFQGQRSAGGCLGCCHIVVVVGSSSGGGGVVWESSGSRVVV